jgi:hypothetical protein
MSNIGHNQIPLIKELAKKQYDIQCEIEKLEQTLVQKKSELKVVQEKQLPDAMDDAGILYYGTDDGLEIEVEDKIMGGLKVENRPAGHSWLEEQGYGRIIKSKVVADFTREELETAYKLVEELRSKGLVVNLERNVHPQTLLAFIKEQLAEGRDIPLEIFSVYQQRSAKVKQKKK